MHPDPPRPWLARFCPAANTHRLEWAGAVHAVAGCSVATNGWGILAVRDGGCQEWPMDFDSRLSTTAVGKLGPFVCAPFAPAMRTDLVSLLMWCECVTWDVCEVCNGHGWEDERCLITCHYCDGKGIWTPGSEAGNARPGLLAGVLVARNRLAWLLAPELLDLPEPSPMLVGTSPQIAGAVVLEAPSWRAVLCGLAEAVNYPQPFPSFHAHPAFAPLWVEREDGGENGKGGSRGILADLLNELGDPFEAVLREEAVRA